MIVYESSGAAPWRRGEYAPFPGVRARIRAVPYPGLEPGGADPWSGQYRGASAEMRIAAATGSVSEWIEALRKAPPGPILIGPAPEAEAVYGAAAAASEAGRTLGRGVVLIDAPFSSAGFPAPASPAGSLVAVAVWRCGEENRLWKEARGIAGTVPFGLALPILPGWTGEEKFLESFLRRCRGEGAGFVVPLEVNGSGPSRAAIHADFARLHPDGADAYFGRIHHGDWDEEVRRGRDRLLGAATAAGLSTRVPVPRGSSDFASNRRAIEALEHAAEIAPEPRAARLRRAVRILEDFGRDLESIARDGNGRLLFDPGSPEWEVVERALADPAERDR